MGSLCGGVYPKSKTTMFFLGVSKNNDTPKSSQFFMIGFPLIIFTIHFVFFPPIVRFNTLNRVSTGKTSPGKKIHPDRWSHLFEGGASGACPCAPGCGEFSRSPAYLSGGELEPLGGGLGGQVEILVRSDVG